MCILTWFIRTQTSMGNASLVEMESVTKKIVMGNFKIFSVRGNVLIRTIFLNCCSENDFRVIL